MRSSKRSSGVDADPTGWGGVLLFRRILLLVLALCATNPTSTLSGVEADSNQVVRRRIELKELWRAGADESEVVFGAAGDPVATSGGGLAVLDYQQNSVFVFSENGRLVKEVDLSGEGPGSVSYPSCLIRIQDNGYALAQGFPASIEKERSAGSFLFRRTNYVDILSAAGDRFGSVYSRERVVDFSRHDYVEDDLHYVQGAAVGPGGEIFVITQRNGYEISVFGPDIDRAVLHRYLGA